MNLKVITVSSKNKHTGKFSIQLATVQQILSGELNALIVVDDEGKDDPMANGKMLKGPDLWKTIGGAISSGFLKAENKNVFFVAERP